ncbi:MAG: hypothetical protein WBC44_15490 [Planctomycetaceae bacterium]
MVVRDSGGERGHPHDLKAISGDVIVCCDGSAGSAVDMKQNIERVAKVDQAVRGSLRQEFTDAPHPAA